jgi:hypothetical protein
LFRFYDRREHGRGQVTVFVILGIVIVLIIALAVYMINNSRQKEFVAPNIIVDEKFVLVQEYVQQCMSQIATEAAMKMGQHGGYIDPTDGLLSGTLFNMYPFRQYDSDMAFITPTDINSGVAYWVYTQSARGCDNCMIGTSAPSLFDMEWQINQYLSRNMQSCLQNFSVLLEQGYTISDTREYDVDTTFTETGVAVIMEADILAKLNDQEIKLEKFFIELDIPMKRYYEIASTIAIKEAEVNFLESVALYLIDSYSGLDSNMLPPTSDSSEDYDITMWSKTHVQQNFQGLLISYMPSLRVPNTKNYFDVNEEGLSPKEEYFYNATRLDFFSNMELKNTDISFLYLGQDIYFDITPSDGEILKPTTVDSGDFSYMFRGRIINRYNFYYQISYPVIVEIHDEYKPGVTFTFMFALESTIKDNLRIKDYYDEDYGPIFWDNSLMTFNVNLPDVKTQSGDLSGYGLDSRFTQDYSGLTEDQLLDKASVTSTSQVTSVLFCNPNQRTSGLVKLKTYDSITNLPLSEVNVKFGCGYFSECDIGSTVFNKTLQESSIQSRLPICKNGYVRLSKQGYASKTVTVSTDSKNNINLGSIFIDPLVEKKVSVKKYYVSKYAVSDEYGNQKYASYTLVNNAEPISGNDSVIISLTKKSFNALDEPFGSSAMISQQYGVNEATLTLAPGVYSVNIQLLDYNGVFIPKECKPVCTEYKSNGKDCKTYTYIPESDIVIRPAPWGGISFENKTLFYVSPEDLVGDNMLEFHIIRMPNPKCIDDMNDISKIGTVSEKYKTVLLPRFVSNE